MFDCEHSLIKILIKHQALQIFETWKKECYGCENGKKYAHQTRTMFEDMVHDEENRHEVVVL